MTGTAAQPATKAPPTGRGRLIALARGWLVLCCLLTTPALADAPPRVMVSVKPIHALVAGLLQGVSEPELIIGQGAPGDYRLTPEVRDRLSQADLIVWVGPELEPALAEPLGDPRLAGRGLELLAQPALKVLPARTVEGGRDPYLWLDTRNMLILLDELTRILSEKDPTRAHRYRSNRQRVLEQIAQVDRELEFGYKDVSALPLFLYHDTEQYFEQAYAMKVAAILTPPGEQPSAENLLKLRSLLGQAQGPCLLTEVGLPKPHLDLLVAGTSTRVASLDALGSTLPPGPDLYARLMRDHYQAIRDCLRPGGNAAPATAPGTAAGEAPVELYSHRIQARYLLRNPFGESVSNLDFHGRFQLIYFGYTFCPDVCPTSLVTLAKALTLLGHKAEQIQPLLITLDPARDTPEVLRTYTAYFHPRLIGLTGPEEMIARTAEQFRVRYEKVPAPDADPTRYSLDHTASLFLLGPDGEFLAKFAYGLPPEELAARLDELVPD
jgi:ABC-type Zn2+ transport system substrate-binding protein/surface adhesin/cytochrome oxidase Cu insertion factor (SCO1/SenC/PrrC family)